VVVQERCIVADGRTASCSGHRKPIIQQSPLRRFADGALLQRGQPGDVRIDAHLKYGERQWRHLVEVHVPEVLKRADVLFDARPEAPSSRMDLKHAQSKTGWAPAAQIEFAFDVETACG